MAGPGSWASGSPTSGRGRKGLQECPECPHLEFCPPNPWASEGGWQGRCQTRKDRRASEFWWALPLGLHAQSRRLGSERSRATKDLENGQSSGADTLCRLWPQVGVEATPRDRRPGEGSPSTREEAPGLLSSATGSESPAGVCHSWGTGSYFSSGRSSWRPQRETVLPS